MTPKEKAEELVNKFSAIQDNINWGTEKEIEQANVIYTKNEKSYDMYYHILAKESALMVVDEMLEVLCVYEDISKDYQYWQQVKQEIDKL